MRTFIKFQCVLLFAFCFSFSFAQSETQIVRIDFQNTEGYTRHLALGFVPDNSATDGVDYGYDAPYVEDLQDDLNWMIEDNRYIIQGVGAFDTNKYYPLGMFLSNGGDISISLNALENFDEDIDVYLYDLELDTYTLLNNSDFNKNLFADNYLNRFYIAFSTSAHLDINSDNLLSNNDNDHLKSLKIWHSNNNLYVKGVEPSIDNSIAIYNFEGKILSEEKMYRESHVINTSEMTTGIYMVRIKSDQFSHTAKVCITN
ncbi:T9SS type A sorting domain-containing protein [Winogradskyella sp. PG-2]|uniref:T9SS type A sorting domain-containing protein n=1 Tax=Winogradskyella sp. PG-2 TaxID=754409 RepID=UPI0004589238|nr:T9SS type A sorting domain-containing protein [Winogradskyella sp. PG-2]BAO76954.1 hypothetical protein WPG_2724 [Winogradskyella sp. PG-2]